MKKNNKLMLYFILGLLFISAFVYLPQSNFRLLFFPPADLYKPLIIEPISLSKKTIVFDLPLTHNYVGSYYFGIYMEKTPPFTKQIESNAALSFNISFDGSTLFEGRYDDWKSGRMGAPETKESGVILGAYKVPDDIPLKLTAKATVTVISTDPTFDEEYGKLEFFLRRFLNK